MSMENRTQHTPLPDEDNILLPPPVPRSMYDPGVNTPRDSYAPSSTNIPGTPPHADAPLIVNRDSSIGTGREKETTLYGEKQPKPKHRKYLLLLAALISLVIIVLAVVLPVYFTVVKPKQHKNNGSAQASAPGSTGSNPGSTPSPVVGATFGRDGSVVNAADGSSFTYQNPFGGYWVSDPTNPHNNAARPQSWVPALNESWTYGKDLIHGVNLGGWFVPEPFIAPALFEKYQNIPNPATDEWSLSQAMAADKSPGGGLSQLETHYQTFITEKDFAEIAGAGLNWIRLPIPYWAIETWDGEPFLGKVCWKYILQAFAWARKYGLRIYLDLHAVPGSQNGYNHSGKGGQVNFLNGVMGLANAERTLGYIRIFTEFISQPEYRDVIPMFGIVNEALLTTIGKETLTSFYLEAYEMVRSITGVGVDHGPYIAIHDGFRGLDSWADFLPNSDRIALDTHPYFAFSGGANTQPLSDFATLPCNAWAKGVNDSQRAFGVTVGGEFSNAVNDCGLWVRGVGGQASYGGDCKDWEDASTWDKAKKDGLLQFAKSSMDSLQNYFFWTWKIGNSTTTNSVRAPLWSYQLGLENGFMPKDPREAYGACASLGVQPANTFDGTFSAWQTGGTGAGNIQAAVSSQFPWPPASIANADAAPTLLPTYTSTGLVQTLSMPTYTVTASGTASTFSSGNGWLNQQDTAGGVTAVAGCTYPNAWDAVGVAVPTACPGGAKKRDISEPRITSRPK